MPWTKDDGGYLIIAEPGCASADALACFLKERSAAPTLIHADAPNALDALRDACRDRAGLDGLIAFHPLTSAALALAIQRRVDRLVLVCGRRPIAEGAAPGMRRFVGRNLPLCAADVLCVDAAPGDLRRLRRLITGSVREMSGAAVDFEGPECEFSVKTAICDFILGESLRNSLAENAEMCIIYR